MLPLLLTGTGAWADQMMAIVAEIGLKGRGYTFSKHAMKIFKNAGDEFTRATQAGAFLYYVEKPPFNMKTFNHWHFKGTPINPEGLEIESHIDEDNVVTNLNVIIKKINNHGSIRSWPWSIWMKVLQSMTSDIYSPLHVSEYFSSEFPNGDKNGRNFMVKVNGTMMSLYDLWETGCGLYSNITNWDEETWETIDNEVTELRKKYPSHETFNLDFVVEENYNYTRDVVYANHKNGFEPDQKYIDECRKHVQINMVRAGKSLSELVSELPLAPIIDDAPNQSAIKTREIIAWSIFFILTPFAALLIWKKHFGLK